MTKTYSNNAKRRILIFSLMGFSACSALLYAYFLNQAIIDGVRVERGEKEISSLSSSVSDLEEQYFAVKNSVTLVKAHELGFVEGNSDLYISRGSATHALSITNEPRN